MGFTTVKKTFLLLIYGEKKGSSLSVSDLPLAFTPICQAINMFTDSPDVAARSFLADSHCCCLKFKSLCLLSSAVFKMSLRVKGYWHPIKTKWFNLNKITDICWWFFISVGLGGLYLFNCAIKVFVPACSQCLT